MSAPAAPLSSSSPASSSASSSFDIPAFFLPFPRADLLIIHCHGNGIDIGGMHGLCRYYQQHLRTHFLLFEYVGYGIAAGEPSEQGLNCCLLSTLRFVTDELHWPLSRVLLFAQSIGSGPACFAAARLNRAQQHLAGIVLQSPFTSIRDVVRDLVGSTAASLVSERWPSLSSCVADVVDPILLIHGVRDELISCSHSERLFDRCGSEQKHILLLNDATHNDFNLLDDVILPVAQFISLYCRIRLQQQQTQAQLTSSASPASPRSSLSSASSVSSLLDSPDDVAAIRALLARHKHVPVRSADGSVCEEEVCIGNAGERIPLNVVVPARFRTVPAAAIAAHLQRVEAARREEEARLRSKERKEYMRAGVAGMWERGKAAWLSLSKAAPAHLSVGSCDAASPRSSQKQQRQQAGTGGSALLSSAVTLPTAQPVPAGTARGGAAAAASRAPALSISVASARSEAVSEEEDALRPLLNSVSHSSLPSCSSPRARLDHSPPSPSPSLSTSRLRQSESASVYSQHDDEAHPDLAPQQPTSPSQPEEDPDSHETDDR